jgi:hypothetical protein
MKVKIIDGVAIDGNHVEPGSVLDLPEGLAKLLIGGKKAVPNPMPKPVAGVMETTKGPVGSVEVRSEPAPTADLPVDVEKPAAAKVNRRGKSKK